MAVFLGYNQYWPGEFMVLCFYVQEHPKAQSAVVLVLKHLRRRGHCLKSHPTDWERPGIEPAIPGLQDRFISYTLIVLAVPVLAGWVYACCELPKVQPAVVLVLKRLRRRGNGLKSHPTDWGKPGIEPATPLVYKTEVYPLHHGGIEKLSLEFYYFR